MDFSQALVALKAGHTLHRRAWEGKSMIKMIMSQDITLLPYIQQMDTATHNLVPWAPSQVDLFAHDWEEIA